MRHGIAVAVVSVIGAVTTALGISACRRQAPDDKAASSPPAAPAPAPPAPTATAKDIPIPDTVAGWKASALVSVYDTQSIYSYIDGHAEVYRAYGMKRCASRRFTGPSGEADLVADVFELASPEDAYGMFTHDRDGEPAGIGRDSLFRYGWLSFWKGPFFVSIIAEGDSERSRNAVLEAGRAIAAVLPDAGGPPAIVSQLPAKDLDPKTVRFLRHPQILNTHVFVSDENVLGLAPDTSVALGTYKRATGRAFVLLADYPDEARAKAAADSFRARMLKVASADEPVRLEDRGFFAVRATGHRVNVVLNASTAADAADLLASATTPLGGTR